MMHVPLWGTHFPARLTALFCPRRRGPGMNANRFPIGSIRHSSQSGPPADLWSAALDSALSHTDQVLTILLRAKKPSKDLLFRLRANLTFCDLFLALAFLLAGDDQTIRDTHHRGRLEVMRVTFSFQKLLENDFLHHSIAVPFMAAAHSMASGRAIKKRL